jgi:two-component system cell cycle sensor histidine kinase/response regulator CckA
MLILNGYSTLSGRFIALVVAGVFMSIEYHVMLVEDNAGDARLLEMRLNEAASQHASKVEFHIRWINLLETAKLFLEQQKYHLIFLDLSLPDSEGLNSIDSLLAVQHNIPIIVLSGMMDTALYDEVLEHGAQGYIQKNDLSTERLQLVLKSTIRGY